MEFPDFMYDLILFIMIFGWIIYLDIKCSRLSKQVNELNHVIKKLKKDE